MPNYSFENLKTKEIKVFFFPLDNHPTWNEVREIEGQKWKRIMEERAPLGIIKNSTPSSSQEFLDETKRKKGTVGDLIERSAELSEQRAKQSPTGRDPTRDKYLDNWSKKRGGIRKHPEDDRPIKKKK